MHQHIAYFKAVCRHKWFVFLACLRFGVPIHSAVFHDWDKFTPEMWLPYAVYFYGRDANKRDASGGYVKAPGQQSAFDYAWNGHQKRNKHHWQYWLAMPQSFFVGYNSNDECTHIRNGGVGCLVAALSSMKGFALDVESLRNERNSDTADRYDDTALFATPTQPSNIERRTKNSTKNTTNATMHVQDGKRLIGSAQRESQSSCEELFLNIMVGLHQNVLAAANFITNFLHLTTSKGVGKNTDKHLQGVWAGQGPIAGQFKTISQRFFGCYATTAIHPMASMDTALISARKTLILVEDSDGCFCLKCKKAFPASELIPLPMPDRARREMMADWFGAGRAYNANWTPLEPRKWYEKNRDKMILHADTRAWVEAELKRQEAMYRPSMKHAGNNGLEV